MRKKKICFLIVLIQIFVIFFSGCHVTRHTVFPDVWEQAQTYQQLGYPSIRRYTGIIPTTNDYLSNRGLQHEGIIVDPYFTVTANGVSIPSYAAAVYSGIANAGVIHSFCSFETDLSQQPVQLSLTSIATILEPRIFPNPGNTNLSAIDKTLTATLTEYGTYTFMTRFPGADYSCTVQIRPISDENAEIQQYIDLYGAENVTIFEPGIHEPEYLKLDSNSVLYLKKGAYLLAKHVHDINSAEDETKSDEGTTGRYGVIDANQFENVTIAGHGIIDMSRLDLHERNGMNFINGKNLTIKDVTLLNSGNWNIYVYRVEGITIDGVTILGSRINSDGINICNSKNATISHCFVRTGDDCFSVKTLGAAEDAPAENILFSDNTAWASKARGFGITGEIEFDIQNVTFENCTVITRDGDWDYDRIGSLVIISETGNGNVRDITFRNIQIGYDATRAINLTVLNPDRKEMQMKNIVFENISYQAGTESQLKATNNTNQIAVVLKNVTANEVVLSEKNLSEFFLCDLNSCSVTFAP